MTLRTVDSKTTGWKCIPKFGKIAAIFGVAFQAGGTPGSTRTLSGGLEAFGVSCPELSADGKGEC